jgi:hypothetical protein
MVDAPAAAARNARRPPCRGQAQHQICRRSRTSRATDRADCCRQCHVDDHRLHRGERRDEDRAGKPSQRHRADPSVPHKVASVPAVGPAGTAFAFDARLWHGAAPNRTAAPRYGITTVTCGPQFRPLENYSRGLRPEVIARCPPDILRRLGFSAWSSYGHTGDPDAVFTSSGEDAMGELD